MDRKTALQKIDTKYHAAADELAAAGFDWTSIFALLMQIGPIIFDWFKKNPPQAAAAKGAAGGGGGMKCPEEAKQKLADAREAACETLCAVLCAEECLGCDD